MTDTYIFTLTGAIEANEKNQLFEWVQTYLRGEGKNRALADNLVAGKPTIVRLVKFPLARLHRIMGPEAGMNYPESREKWEGRVEHLVGKISNKVPLPPLIVTDFWKELEISDGNHRQEALLRSGISKYWTIFFFNKAESNKLLPG